MSLSLPRTLTVGRTDPGLVRSVNEDALLARPEIGLWAVADGMGGHKNGRRASTLIIEALGAVTGQRDMAALCDAAASAVHAANSAIYDESTEAGEAMGSTVACLLFTDGAFAVLWAGDSRAYLIRDGDLIQLTRDHTQVQDMVERGLLGEDDVVGHPMGHVLSRAVGVEPTLELDVVMDQREDDDLFLLCSDGLHGVVSEAAIREAFLTGGLDAACDGLIALCKAAGAPDNVTLIAVAGEPTTVLMLGGGEEALA